MKFHKLILASVIAAMVLNVTIMPVSAYFTANTEAEGGLRIVPESNEPHEYIVDKEKRLTIENDVDAAPVFVRARGFSGDDSDLTYDGENWHDGGDGWWYYDEILEAGQTTEALVISIEKVLPEDAEPGDNFNVIVVYESTRVKNGYTDAESAFRSADANDET